MHIIYIVIRQREGRAGNQKLSRISVRSRESSLTIAQRPALKQPPPPPHNYTSNVCLAGFPLEQSSRDLNAMTPIWYRGYKRMGIYLHSFIRLQDTVLIKYNFAVSFLLQATLSVFLGGGDLLIRLPVPASQSLTIITKVHQLYTLTLGYFNCCILSAKCLGRTGP